VKVDEILGGTQCCEGTEPASKIEDLVPGAL